MCCWICKMLWDTSDKRHSDKVGVSNYHKHEEVVILDSSHWPITLGKKLKAKWWVLQSNISPEKPCNFIVSNLTSQFWRQKVRYFCLVTVKQSTKFFFFPFLLFACWAVGSSEACRSVRSIRVTSSALLKTIPFCSVLLPFSCCEHPFFVLF